MEVNTSKTKVLIFNKAGRHINETFVFSSFVFYILSHLFPLPCGAGSTVPARVRLKCYYAFFLMCCGCDTFYIVSVHIQCQASIYTCTLSLCRGRSWRVRLAKRETLTPPGHLVSPLVCRVRECPPWCSIVDATVTVHQFFCILHFCHTCSLCRVELVVQFPARGSTQVLLCLFPDVLWL